MLVDGVRDDGLDLGRETLGAGCRVGGQERPNVGTTGAACPPEQGVDLAALDAELGRGPVHVGSGAPGQAGERCHEVAAPGRGFPVCIGVPQFIDARKRERRRECEVVGEGDAGRISGDRLTRLPAQQHGVGAERALHAPVPARMPDRGSGDEAPFHHRHLLVPTAETTLHPLARGQERIRTQRRITHEVHQRPGTPMR